MNQDQPASLQFTAMRLDYAWKYFDSAAQKRMQYINYFVILVGILANAYVLAAKDGEFAIALAVCLFGVACAITFMMLDHRMLVFVERANMVLESLEREVIFPDGATRVTRSGPTTEQLGLARIEPDMRSTATAWQNISYSLSKVKLWVRFVVEGGAALAFGTGAIHAFINLVC
ncbi:MAG: hypothetical protein IT430_17290 [Phycisphaerales bacterium]|nr:hypothetical protein [Phycisphaerales bacterium]